MIDEKLLEEEIKKLNKQIQQQIEEIYSLYKNPKGNNETITLKIKKVLEELFKMPYGNAVIPIEFLDSEIGKLLFTLRYSNAERLYSTQQVAEIWGVSPQYISKLANEGKIPPGIQAKGRYFTESQVREYGKYKKGE